MSQRPFLLEPRYAGTLDSDAFRHKFVELNHLSLPRMAATCAACFLPLLLVAPPLATYYFTGDPFYWFGSLWALAAAIVIMGVLLIWWGFCWRRYWRMHRLAWRGQLVEGCLLSARRKRAPASDSEDADIIVFEVEYRADLDGGCVTGIKSRKRDDLLNTPLPEPGTPVFVLYCNAKTHTIL
jgi:hypothetical protein